MLCNSWIVVDRATGLPVFETYSQRISDAINRAKYEVLTAHEWLVRLNKNIAENRRIAERRVRDLVFPDTDSEYDGNHRAFQRRTIANSQA